MEECLMVFMCSNWYNIYQIIEYYATKWKTTGMIDDVIREIWEG